jgi:glycyl-tRNA synthetase beta chain
MPDFLLEIGCEEIPARMIDAGAAELRERVANLLSRERLNAREVSTLQTPRRLAVLVQEIPEKQPDITEQLTGPSLSVAYKDGQPTPAAHAFAKRVGIEISRVTRVTTAKGEYLAAEVTKKGRTAAEILAETLPKEISSIYWPKNMYWRKPNELFVRPVRWLVAMIGGEVIPLEFDGVRAGKLSRGHRILAEREISIPSAGPAYVDALHSAKVLGREARERQIRKQLDAATRTIAGARWREDKELLDTVINLTEFPSVILGTFDLEFLALAEEVLVTVMRDHQKYFAVEDANGKLAPHFLAVLNTDGDPQGIIRHGHERVLRARFNDARFFWETDQKISLRDRLQLLKHVTFQKDLGSYFDKTQRVQRLASWVSEIVRQSGIAIRPGVVHKAACLAKADLTTELVKEFTELQGIVGGLYARVQQLDEGLPEATRFAVADAIYDHYKPESMDDSVPRSIEGGVLSLADKADSIAGMFMLGKQPSGSKDPFGLRRQANGIVKILVEFQMPLRLSEIFDAAWYKEIAHRHSSLIGGVSAPVAFSQGKTPSAQYINAIREFFNERLEFYLKDYCGYEYDTVKAVLAVNSDYVADTVPRAKAVKEVRNLPEFQAIAAACKRVRNILRQAKDGGITPAARFEFMPDEADESKMLAARLEKMVPRIEKDREKRDYVSALLMLATLREPVDRFFDKVMVMVEEQSIRANRLALLATLLKEFSTIADFSEIVTEGKG